MKPVKEHLLIITAVVLCLAVVLGFWLQLRADAPRVGDELFGEKIVSIWKGSCDGISDGDSISVRNSRGEHFSIRLAGIDAPQRFQAWGYEAKELIFDYALGESITVLETGKELSGQKIGFVLVNGRNVNVEMLKRGAAWFDENHSTSVELKAIEQYARERKFGLWSSSKTPQAPWEFPHWGTD